MICVVHTQMHVHRYSRASVGSEVTSYSSNEHSLACPRSSVVFELSCPRSSVVFEPPITGSGAMCTCLSSANGL